MLKVNLITTKINKKLYFILTAKILLYIHYNPKILFFDM